MKSVKTVAVLTCLLFLTIATVTGIAQAGEWIEKADTPEAGGYGEAVVGTGNYIYAAKCLYASSTPYFWRYDPSINNWDFMNTSGIPTGAFRNGATLAYDRNDYLYALLGGRYSDTNRHLFYRYSLSIDSWEKLIDTPHAQGAGDAITWSGFDNQIYAILGSKEHGTAFANYNFSDNSWSTLPLNPSWTTTDDGASLVWTGGEYLYALRGEWQETVPCQDYARYHIPTKTWEDMSSIPESEGVGDGGSLLWVNNYPDYIFALGGNSCLEDPGYNFYRYSISSDSWEDLEPIPCPVGNYVGNRLGFAGGYIYYWQGTPSTWECDGSAFYMFELTVEDKIFDNGIWWIEKNSSEPHLGWMKVYLNGEYKGECSRLDFGHKVEGENSWPQVAAIYASGYIRLKECRDPDITFGTSFVLGPGYWEGSNYYHNASIEEMYINSSKPFRIQIKAKLPHFNMTYSIEMAEPDSKSMKIHVNQICECTNQLTLNESRLKEQEGFKITQLSSMYINETYHDSDGAKYIDESGKLSVRKFEDLKTNQFIFENPRRLGEGWLECTHSDDYSWQGNTPNCIISLDNLTLAKDCTPQGWITITSDPNEDNIGLWIHHDKTQLEWNAGDKEEISYWLIAQDDPIITIFDTGKPTNPYPSIFGVHNGTIKPNQTITVSTLYTYPCSGTGGHSEYMKIWNSSDWNVTARWEGYIGDWHNISFDSSFTLGEGETYNYTIRTGSYPQIHHTDNLSTSAGFITCSEFIDANGKVYDDWIPAIKLE